MTDNAAYVDGGRRPHRSPITLQRGHSIAFAWAGLAAGYSNHTSRQREQRNVSRATPSHHGGGPRRHEL